MNLSGSDIPKPMLQFTDYPFTKEVSQYIASMAFESPTPIQSQGIPIALSGRDMIGIAKVRTF